MTFCILNITPIIALVREVVRAANSSIIEGFATYMSLPLIAIVGRPNVGKSTLFNRLIGKRYAITSPVPGTTRDRIYHEAELGTSKVILVDTGGMEFEKKTNIEGDVQAQARLAVSEANILFFVIDATEPLTRSDRDCALLLRKSKKPIVLIAHKADRKRIAEAMPELYELGLGDPLPISSIHNLGLDELNEETASVLRKMKWKSTQKDKSPETKIAIVGKPNVGKSSMINALIGSKRAIVSETPGTTIDAIDTPLKTPTGEFILIDTAGLRRRGKVDQGIEKYGVLRALRAISRCDITCLVLDWEEGISNQDLHVAQYILDAGKGLIIVVNKSDLMKNPGEDKKRFMRQLHYRMQFVPWAPVLFTSTITKRHLTEVLTMAKSIESERKKKVPAKTLQIFTETTYLAHPPTRKSKEVIIYKGTQTDVDPPLFTFETNQPDLIHFSYRRYLENELRRKFGFAGTVIRLEFVKRK